jgi:hypothetical protein
MRAVSHFRNLKDSSAEDKRQSTDRLVKPPPNAETARTTAEVAVNFPKCETNHFIITTGKTIDEVLRKTGE